MSYTQKDYEQFTYNFLMNNGLKKNTVYGIMGCIWGESEFNPDIIEVGSGVGFGLCQWSYERRTALENYGTSFTHQLNFLWSELTGENTSQTGATFQWIDYSGCISYDDFMAGNCTIEESVHAFLWCFERPNKDYAREDVRLEKANEYSNTYTSGGGDVPSEDYSDKIKSAVEWAIEIANDDSHGYDQNNRWGNDYDCSSLIISAYEQAGIPLKTNGATYTGNMKEVCLECGFEEIEIDDWESTDQFEIGDIILNEAHHVCMYIGDGQIVQASINELGTTTGGETGDQTGKEIYVRDYYVYSSGWDCCLRLPASGVNVDAKTEEVYKAVIETSYNINQLTEEELEMLKSLTFTSSVKIKYTYNHNKKILGTSFFGNRLNLDNKEYIIKDVRSNGFLILVNGGNGIPKYVNPKYVILCSTEGFE